MNFKQIISLVVITSMAFVQNGVFANTSDQQKFSNKCCTSCVHYKFTDTTSSNTTTQLSSTTHSLQELIDRNKKWAKETKAKNHNFFKDLSKSQKPKYLWIGCADSRVPATEIFDLKPGNLFVHRNIANMVIHSDFNSLAVIQYAVDVLKVEHIIICGHYNCGGVKAALSDKSYGLIDNWLAHIKDVYRFNKDKVNDCHTEKEKLDLMCEINVAAQVTNICQNPTIRNAWKRGQKLTVHGLVYDLKSGLINDLGIEVSSSKEASQR